MSEIEIIVSMDKHIKIKGGHYVQDLIRCANCKWCMIQNNADPYCEYHAMAVDDRYFCADAVEGEWMT